MGNFRVPSFHLRWEPLAKIFVKTMLMGHQTLIKDNRMGQLNEICSKTLFRDVAHGVIIKGVDRDFEHRMSGLASWKKETGESSRCDTENDDVFCTDSIRQQSVQHD